MVVSGASDILIISSSYVVELTTGEGDETTAGAGVVESIPCRRLSKWPRAEATELGLCEECRCESRYCSEVALAKCT